MPGALPDLEHLLTAYRSIAVVGISRDPRKAAHWVPAYFQAQGYAILPVNPSGAEILGVSSRRRLADLAEPIEILQVFRPSEETPEIVAEAVTRRRERGDVAAIWLQLGIRDDRARALAEAEGIPFVQDRCMYEEFRRLGLGPRRDRPPV